MSEHDCPLKRAPPELGVVAHPCNPALGRRADLSELELSLVCEVQDSQCYPEKPCSRKTKQKWPFQLLTANSWEAKAG